MEERKPYIDQFIDLHLHMDGAITVPIAKRLAQIQGMELPAKTDEELEDLLTVSEDCVDLTEFLACFELPGSLLHTKEALSEAVYLVAENVRSQGVIYAELRFAPQRHTDKGMSQEDAILAALEGLKRSSLKANLIVCLMRGEGNEQENWETVELAHKYLVPDGGVTALDIAGAEALFPTSDYGKYFEKAREYGIPYTIHAGEAAGADSVRAAMDFGAKRIGHGVRMKEDPALEERALKEGITFEMCPTSNIQTHAVDDMTDYPFMDYLHRGLRVTLNTDDAAIEGTTLAREFAYMEQKFGLTEEEEKQILSYSVDAAFTTEEVKEKLRKELGLMR